MGVFRKFPRTFWVANTIELFERCAWYGFFMLFARIDGLVVTPSHGYKSQISLTLAMFASSIINFILIPPNFLFLYCLFKLTLS